MRESRPYGSVRGDWGNPVPYRDHLATEPPQMPRISWSVYRGKGWEETLVGAPAPSIEVAKARAEALWRAFLGYKRA